jgi:hypothetical protein
MFRKPRTPRAHRPVAISRPTPTASLQAFAGTWAVTARLEPRLVSVYGSVVRRRISLALASRCDVRS